MWKYVSCCVRETLERSVNYLDARCGAGLASNQQTLTKTCIVVRKQKQFGLVLQERAEGEGNGGCSGEFGEKDTRRNEFNWHNCHILHSWINAFTWSGAIILGWYSSQLLCLSQKRRHLLNNPEIKKISLRRFICSNTRALHCAVSSRVAFAYPNNHEQITPQSVVNTTHINDHTIHDAHGSFENEKQSAKNGRSFEDSLDEAVRGLTNVLSSVENRLGLAAIEGGSVTHGIEMLQSAAERNHAPALYNLALCYQKGIGVRKNEKLAAELYESAAALDHPAAIYNLAIYHGQGRGGFARNPVIAEKFLRMAASKGQEDAIKTLFKMDAFRQPQSFSSTTPVANVTVEACPTDVPKIHNDTDKDPYTPMHSFLNIISGKIPNYSETQRVFLY